MSGTTFQFLSTLSLRRATCVGHSRCALMAFLSTLSLRRATQCPCTLGWFQCHFYPRSPCGERPDGHASHVPFSPISIHALLAESDGDMRTAACGWIPLFLSTLSLRRATAPCPRAAAPRCHFYPRSPCGERRASQSYSLAMILISIHALLAESDCRLLDTRIYTKISIHALLAESDPQHQVLWPPVKLFLSTLSLRRATYVLIRYRIKARYFYPRSPCGERPGQNLVNSVRLIFLSTLSLRRATVDR